MDRGNIPPKQRHPRVWNPYITLGNLGFSWVWQLCGNWAVSDLMGGGGGEGRIVTLNRQLIPTVVTTKEEHQTSEVFFCAHISLYCYMLKN